MLEVYLDESISYFGPDPERRALLVMAGYVAERDHWVSFSAAWAAALQAYGLSHFHAKELRSHDARLYRHLSFERRRELLSRLCALIAEHVLFGVAAYMRPDDYERTTTPEFRSRMGSTYGALVDLILLTLSGTLPKPAGAPDRVNIFLESGHKNAQEALGQIAKYKDATEPVPDRVEGVAPDIIHADPMRTTFMRIGEFSLAPKKDAAPLQAADILVYLIGAAAHIKDPAPVFEGTLDGLLQSRLHVLSPWGREAVTTLVETEKAADMQAARIRAELYQYKRRLRSFGLKVNQVPWGITIDGRHLSEDEWQNFLRSQKDSLDS